MPADTTGPPAQLTRRTAKWLWPALVLAAVAAVVLAAHLLDEILEGESFGLDPLILQALREPGRPDVPVGPVWLTQSAIDLSALGGFTLQWLFGAAGLGFLAALRRWREALLIAGSLVGASVIDAAVKHLVGRPRPEVVPHLAVVSNASFPSGHAMISAAIYLTVAAMLCETQTSRRVRAFVMAAAVILVVLIGASRVYLGVHWPSDVLAGWCFGGAWAVAVLFVNRLAARRLTPR